MENQRVTKNNSAEAITTGEYIICSCVDASWIDTHFDKFLPAPFIHHAHHSLCRADDAVFD